MPILILILSVAGGALWFWVRNNPRDAFHAAQDAATVLKNAPRKLAFRKQTNSHPVEGIDDPRIAICAIAQSFIELDNLPTQEQRQRLHVNLRAKLRCSEDEAEEMEVLGRWLMTQCKERWSREFGPVVKVDRMKKVMIQNDKKKEPFARFQSQGCA
jgi:hypothetical protein